VAPSGFYASQTRPESRHAQEDRRLKVLLQASYAGGRGYYGSPRIHDDFVEWGEHVSRKRIIRLKQEEGLQARVRKRYKVTTDSQHDQPIADNLLRQDFTAERPNQRWVGDTSELRIGDQGKGVLSLCTLPGEEPPARGRLRDAQRANDDDRIWPVRVGVLSAHRTVVYGRSRADRGAVLQRDRRE
jgi:putative transposase